MGTLSPNAFKMWVYLGKNQNDYTFALSKVDTLKWCGFSKNTYTTVFNELENKGYLVKGKGNHYDFFEIPPEEPGEPTTITIHKDIERQENFVF